MISSDYRVYIGSSMIVDRFGDCYCTCALINWTVLLQGGWRVERKAMGIGFQAGGETVQ